QLGARGVDVGLDARDAAVGLLQLLHAGRQLAFGARGPVQGLVVVGPVPLGHLGLLGQVAALDLGDAGVVLLVPPRQLGAAAVLGRLQLRDAPGLLLGDVPLPPLFGGLRLLFVALPHPHDLGAVIALFLLGQRLVGLPLGGQLGGVLVAQRLDGLLVITPQARDLAGQPLGGLRLFLGHAPLQGLDLGPVGGLDAGHLGFARPLRAGQRLAVLVGEPGDLVPVRLGQLGQARLHLAPQPLGLGARPLLVLNIAALERVDLFVGLAQLAVRVVQAGLELLLAL